ncbi:hypothetical protein C1752_03341 [Acaryochloris thomasi RCC1774]|uniref:Uncharacterized protein n=1 Tax=Acaryochloris thomasi RCC1774 TaxID=1764569 RepID=A0A2W1JN55_9CYAN|nr:hypothetical protein [Acaryochloris thomasi]PZD72875.1 hypothetical protein C1752_03341 [Acaryochloris thomasi RCC1774]
MSDAQLRLTLTEGSVTFSFDPKAAQDLKAAIAELMKALKASAAATPASGGKITPQKPMEYQYTGEIFLECFCNPNIYPSPFAAKVLATIRDDKIRLTSEVELTRLIEDLNVYLDQHG